METNDLTRHSRDPLRRSGSDADQQIVVTTIRGPIDVNVVKEVSRARLRCLAELDLPAVATITVIQDSMHITPDALAHFTAIMHNHMSQNRYPIFAACVAAQNVEGRSTGAPLIEAAYRSVNIPWRCFDQLDDAREWAATMLDAVQGSQLTFNTDRS